MSIKVAFLLGSLNRGGAETLILDIISNAEILGLSTSLIYRKDGELKTDYINTGRPIIKLKPKNRFDLYYFIRLRKILLKENIKIVHAQQPIDAFFIKIACWRTNICTALTVHGHYYHFSKYKQWFLKNLFAHMHLLVFVSQTQLNDFDKRGLINTTTRKKAFVIHNGVSLKKLVPQNTNSLASEFDLSGNEIILGSVGNFGAGRDQMTICRFLNLLNQKGVIFRFFFIGKKNNNEPDRYENCVQFVHDNDLNNRVFFLGSRNDVPEILNQLDAFIYSSEHDTFGIAVIEAMLAQKVIFVNDLEIMKEITEDGTVGTIFQTKNEQDLFEKFMHFYKNQTLYKNKARRVSEYVSNKYNINTYIQTLQKHYFNLT